MKEQRDHPSWYAVVWTGAGWLVLMLACLAYATMTGQAWWQ